MRVIQGDFKCISASIVFAYAWILLMHWFDSKFASQVPGNTGFINFCGQRNPWNVKYSMNTAHAVYFIVHLYPTSITECSQECSQSKVYL